MAACDTDRHVLAVDNYTCTLYEAWRCQAPSGPSGEGLPAARMFVLLPCVHMPKPPGLLCVRTDAL